MPELPRCLDCGTLILGDASLCAECISEHAGRLYQVIATSSWRLDVLYDRVDYETARRMAHLLAPRNGIHGVWYVVGEVKHE